MHDAWVHGGVGLVGVRGGLWDGVGLVEWKNGNAKKSHTRIYSCVVAFVFWYMFLVVKIK